MKKIAIFPGSFDPFTVGHYSIVQRALNFVDEVVIEIEVNDEKKSLFSIEIFRSYQLRSIDMDYCSHNNCNCIYCCGDNSSKNQNTLLGNV